ncbi:hypothetical protein ACFL27_25600 [candidate division CSSED10-310 bacterium]|uniref:Uncharacterized protein n=1 Tax=candidate division CSSED10-310 bacterium TaxID=2855610 RepID=A0ABV6Z568_UNCC1
MKWSTLLLIGLFLVVASPAATFDKNELPQFKRGNKVYGYIPPAGSVTATEQWPQVGWVEYKGVPFVVYAKLTKAYDPATGKGRFEVWLAPPQSYIREIEKDHPYGPADANAYLQKTGFNQMVGRFYKGPGNVYVDPEGYQAWTAQTDRLLLCIYEPSNGKLAPKAFALHEVYLGSFKGPLLLGGHVLCQCPDYKKGKTKPDQAHWITLILTGKKTQKVDQWGLPGNSPVPTPQTETAKPKQIKDAPPETSPEKQEAAPKKQAPDFDAEK